jgi:hypothetical protein
VLTGRTTAASRPFYAQFAAYTEAICQRLSGFAEATPEPLQLMARQLAREWTPSVWTHPYSFPLAHLPLWILDHAGALPEGGLSPSAIAYGYAAHCGYLYIRLQDDVYDDPGSAERARRLLIGNELILECVGTFRRFFAPDSPFHRCLRRYFLEFGQATLWEMEHHWGRYEPFAEEDVLCEGRKLSLAKAPCAAALLELSREDCLGQVEEALECLQAGNQLLNDVAGLVRDIDAANVTYPLAHATGEAFDWQAEGEEAVRARRMAALGAVMRSEAVERTLDLAAELHARALARMGGLASPHFDDYVDFRTGFIRECCEDYTRLRLTGAFSALSPR